jgi:hypothetical protein
MGTDKKRLFQVAIRAKSIQGKKCAASIGRTIVRNVLLLGIVFMFSIPWATNALASGRSGTVGIENLDTRWLPWIGSWRLVSGTEETTDSALKDPYLLTTSPGDSENAIIMKGYRSEQVLFEEKIEADGFRRPKKEENCSGWQAYGWSNTGKRLLFQGESDCTGDFHQAVSGMSFIDGDGDWLDIQLLQSEKEKTITVRRYRNIDTDTIAPGRTSADPARIARVSAGTGFSIGEIIELSDKVDSAVLEAALAEMHKPFPINSKQILRLADSGVPTRIVDLMVALSFPDEFVVEKATISRIQKFTPRHLPSYFRPYDRCWPCYHPMFPWHWSMSYYSLYDWWYLDRYYWPGWYHSSWWYPGYAGGGYGVDTGRLVEGQGYTRVYPDNGSSPARYARPRNTPTGQGAVNRKASSASSSNKTAVYSGSSSSGSRSTSPSASPGGYSSGNSSRTEETEDY